MSTTERHRRLVAATAATLALTVLLALDVAPGQSASGAAGATSVLTSRLGHACSAPPGYGWPVRPFHRAHAIRGSFGDPRIGLAPSGLGLTHAFHTGVDVVAADGTPVYATLTGTVMLPRKSANVVWILDGKGTTFSYWHVVPAIHSGQSVTAYETVIGRVQKPWGHVHFAELRDHEYLNPLRAGGMGPYTDRTPPEVATVTLEHRAHPMPLDRAHGSLDVIAQVDDPPAHAIAAPWDGLAVMPAKVRWRLRGPDSAGTNWATAVDYTKTIPSGASYGRIYAQWTRQNHPAKQGRYRVYLAHALSTRNLPTGRYRVEIEASDLCGNRTTAGAWLNLDNGSTL